eukprot:CAMPEP_0182458528 /NCGR_PEP_ID=MMETSP1319-20130603/3852_1 /TAXON_ID=172717 /ORGANISM="Bolidomonas pacifica, Strain RCC208" /LENGTH=218 /DNA_ID=CAMNT_0024657233 /DNA_START=9 /DNA_END=662 /DNA_ORIENTATION=+
MAEESSTYQLTYFGLRGRGEPIRIAMQDNGIAYSEAGPSPSWPEAKAAGLADGTIPFGQLPLLTTPDGLALVQMNNILRFLQRKHLTPDISAEDEAVMGVALESAEDWRGKYLTMIYGHRMSDESVATFTEQATNFSQMFDSWLERRGTDYLCGAEPTVADYSLFCVVDDTVRTVTTLLDERPLLAAFYARMQARAGVAAYLGSNPEHRERVNGNGLG